MQTETLSTAVSTSQIHQEGKETAPSHDTQTAAQQAWAQLALAARLTVLRRARHQLANLSSEVAAAIPARLSRTPADTLAAELLPLLEAIRFLERQAPRLLRSRRLGRRGLPFWLAGIDAEIHRVSFGRVLVIGPSNYPLFLPGVQVFQALAAGNAVTWKPGLGGAPVAHLVAQVLHRCGLPDHLLHVTEDTIEAAQTAVSAGPAKVFFTGSATTGTALLRQLAETATPSVLELSGNDACVVLPSANLDRVVAALTFGLRLNGSATCMAPRRILLVDLPAPLRQLLVDRLHASLAAVPPVTLPASTRRQLAGLLTDATAHGAIILGDSAAEDLRPLLLLNGSPSMQIAQADLFAPVLTLIDVAGTAGVLAAEAACPLALTASIFGDERSARTLAQHLTAGTVLINDLIVPTADPRVPFGGRKGSGFGVTRGAEGLLEMTAVKVISTRRNRSSRHFEPTGPPHVSLFAGILSAAHAGTLPQRWSGLKRVLTAAMELKQK